MLIAHRYRLIAPIGRGSGGMVYHAWDRLRGQDVALKRVRTIHETDSPIEQSFSEEERFMLADEFRIMASLHHPNIIEVLDYGFDDDQPFFTMTLLNNPRTVVEQAQTLNFRDQILLFSQFLGAIQYLHRRGILHRDLKPANVLVNDNRLRVLDFGLALEHDRASAENAGTMLYLAPEVLYGRQPPSIASDLYSIGVIFYEMLTGHYPFEPLMQDMAAFITRMPDAEPDLSLLPEKVQPVMSQLLNKVPEKRHKDIRELMLALSTALGWSISKSQFGSQESSLSASRFVGRKREMATLTDALDSAIVRQGSLWLIGGDSGIGKSRLLDELRIRALIQGVIVLQGQERQDGGLSWQIWREPTTRLALITPMSDHEASVLRELVPDLARLLDRPLPAIESLAAYGAHQQRLIDVLIALFLRQPKPVLLILEDLQWTIEGLKPLEQLTEQLADRAILIVGSYRDNEPPGLGKELPAARTLKLDRLTIPESGELTRAILGDPPNMVQIAPVIDQVSAGNAFYILEAIRALANAAGGLNKIAALERPADIFVDGIQVALDRRLTRLEPWARSILSAAAVLGRILDLKVLRVVAQPRHSLSGWLTLCSEAAVLEIRDGVWLFAHDQIREAVLAAMSTDERIDLHQQAARAIETVYPNDPAYASVLFSHWQHVPTRPDKLMYYAPLVGEALQRAARLSDAIALYESVLPLIDPADRDRQAEFSERIKVWRRGIKQETGR